MSMWKDLRDLIVGRRSSSDQAKGRLHLVLAHDRSGLDGGKLQELREELSQVISKYVDVDLEHVDIRVERVDRDSTELKVSSPLRPRGANAN